jgi:hypothetical protein
MITEADEIMLVLKFGASMPMVLKKVRDYAVCLQENSDETRRWARFVLNRCFENDNLGVIIVPIWDEGPCIPDSAIMTEFSRKIIFRVTDITGDNPYGIPYE